MNSQPTPLEPTSPAPLGNTSTGSEAPRPWRPELQGMAAGPGGDSADGLDESAALPVDLGVVGASGRLKASLTRANLVLFGLFLVGVGVVAFMSLRKGPQATSAAEQQAEKQAGSAIDRFLKSQESARAKSGASGQQAEQLLRDTRSLVQMFSTFGSKSQVELDDLRTNPFRFGVDPDVAAKNLADQQKALAAAKDTAEAARKKKLEKLRTDLAKLRLQTVLSGPAGRQAMINATVVRVGDSVDGFKVEQIEARRVVLSGEGETFVLEIGF